MRRIFFSFILKLFRLPKSAVPTDRKGHIVILIDGLSYNALREAMKKGQCRFLSSLLKKEYALSPYYCGLPAATTASEAELFFGSHDNIPGFTWFDRSLKRFVRGNRGQDIEIFEKSFVKKDEFLRGGSCLLGVYSSGATLCDISGKDADLKNPFRMMSKLNAVLFVFMNPIRFFLTFYLLVKSIFSSIAVIVLKKSKRSFVRMIKDSLSNFLLGNALTYIAELEILRETPVLFIDYVLFDEFAHMYGIYSRTSLSSLRLIDWYCESLYKASGKAGRQYDFLVLSDHGQTVSRPIDKHPEALERLFAQALQNPVYRPVRTYGLQKPGMDEKEIYLVPAGSMVQVYYAEHLENPLSLEDLESGFPRLIPSLLKTKEIGWVLVRTKRGKQILFGKHGSATFRQGRVENTEGQPFKDMEVDGRTLSSFATYAQYKNNGDLVLFADLIAPHRIYSFEEHLGTHGGFYGDMTMPFVLTGNRLILEKLKKDNGMDSLFALIRSSRAQN